MMEEIIYRLLDGESDVLDGIQTTTTTSSSSSTNTNTPFSPSLTMNEISNNITNDNNDDNKDDDNDEQKIGSMGFTQSIQNEFIPLLKDEPAFEVFTNCLTCPSKNLNEDDDDDDDDDDADEDSLEEDPNNDDVEHEKEEGQENQNQDDNNHKSKQTTTNNDSTIATTTTTTTANKHIKRSFRTMTLLVNDTNSAQQLHQQIGISNMANMTKKQSQLFDEEKVYSKFLLSPTRAVWLAKKIFAAYHDTYRYHCDLHGIDDDVLCDRDCSAENRSGKHPSADPSNTSNSGSSRSSSSSSSKLSIRESLLSCTAASQMDHTKMADGTIHRKKSTNSHHKQSKLSSSSSSNRSSKKHKTKILPHLPHLNKTLSALLAAYPKQVILASISSSSSSTTTSSSSSPLSQTLEPMLQLQKFCSDYSSPIQTLVDIIIMGCTGKKRENSNLQQQQAMMMAAMNNNNNGGGGYNNLDPMSIMNQVYIHSTHRKKFVRSLSQWGLVQQFVNVITATSSSSSLSSSTTMTNNHKDIYYEHVAESACDALIAIVEFICFPQELHPALGMNGNMNLLTNQQQGNKNSSNRVDDDDKKDESAGEEELFTPLTNINVISQLANCAYCQSLLKKDEESKSLSSLTSFENHAEASSRTLLGLFEIASGKARKSMLNNQQPPAMDGMTEVGDDGSIECKAQNDDNPMNNKDLPGIDDNKLLKAGITLSMHSTLVSNIELIVKAMDVKVKNMSSTKAEGDGNDGGGGGGGGGDGSAVENASSHAVSHPGRYTIERPFTSRRLDLITLFADIISYEDHNQDKVNRLAATKAMEALTELPIPALNKEIEDGVVYSPWPGLCDYLFDYPENSLYGIQFYRILHAICMANHEKTLKIVVQKCKFLSKAIKECKNKSSGSNRGVLLKCLNALRLHSQSIGPHCFLRHYFDSHDGWKAFESDLKK